MSGIATYASKFRLIFPFFTVLGVSLAAFIGSLTGPWARVSPGTVSYLITNLHHYDRRVRRETAFMLRIVGPQALSALMTASDDPDYEVRALVLLAMKPSSRRCEAFYLKGLKDSDPYVRLRAAEIIRELAYEGHSIGRAIPVLISILDDSREVVWVRCGAAEALDAFGTESLAAVPALFRALQHPDQNLQTYVTWTLGMIGPDDRMYPQFCKQLKSPYFEVRAAAAIALGHYGMDAIAPLSRAFDEDNGNMEQAASALGRIGGPGVEFLLERYSGGGSRIRVAAVKGAVHGNNEVDTWLQTVKSDPDSDVRDAAESVIEQRRQRAFVARKRQLNQWGSMVLIVLGAALTWWTFRPKLKV